MSAKYSSSLRPIENDFTLFGVGVFNNEPFWDLEPNLVTDVEAQNAPSVPCAIFKVTLRCGDYEPFIGYWDHI